MGGKQSSTKENIDPKLWKNYNRFNFLNIENLHNFIESYIDFLKIIGGKRVVLADDLYERYNKLYELSIELIPNPIDLQEKLTQYIAINDDVKDVYGYLANFIYKQFNNNDYQVIAKELYEKYIVDIFTNIESIEQSNVFEKDSMNAFLAKYSYQHDKINIHAQICIKTICQSNKINDVMTEFVYLYNLCAVNSILYILFFHCMMGEKKISGSDEKAKRIIRTIKKNNKKQIDILNAIIRNIYSALKDVQYLSKKLSKYLKENKIKATNELYNFMSSYYRFPKLENFLEIYLFDSNQKKLTVGRERLYYLQAIDQIKKSLKKLCKSNPEIKIFKSLQESFERLFNVIQKGMDIIDKTTFAYNFYEDLEVNEFNSLVGEFDKIKHHLLYSLQILFFELSVEDNKKQMIEYAEGYEDFLGKHVGNIINDYDNIIKNAGDIQKKILECEKRIFILAESMDLIIKDYVSNINIDKLSNININRLLSDTEVIADNKEDEKLLKQLLILIFTKKDNGKIYANIDVNNPNNLAEVDSFDNVNIDNTINAIRNNYQIDDADYYDNAGGDIKGKLPAVYNNANVIVEKIIDYIFDKSHLHKNLLKSLVALFYGVLKIVGIEQNMQIPAKKFFMDLFEITNALTFTAENKMRLIRELNHREKYAYRLYDNIIKSMGMIILSTITINNMKEEIDPRLFYINRHIRTFLGGREETKIIPHAVELYIRLLLYSSFYQKLFPIRADAISYIPYDDSIFNTFIYLFFNKIDEKIQDMDNDTMEQLFDEINKIYLYYKGQNKDIRQCIQDFIKTISKKLVYLDNEDETILKDAMQKQLSLKSEKKRKECFLKAMDKIIKRKTLPHTYFLKKDRSTTVDNIDYERHVTILEKLKDMRKDVGKYMNLKNLNLSSFNAFYTMQNYINQIKNKIENVSSNNHRLIVLKSAIDNIYNYSAETDMDILYLLSEFCITPLILLNTILKLLNRINIIVIFMKKLVNRIKFGTNIAQTEVEDYIRDILKPITGNNVNDLPSELYNNTIGEIKPIRHIINFLLLVAADNDIDLQISSTHDDKIVIRMNYGVLHSNIEELYKHALYYYKFFTNITPTEKYKKLIKKIGTLFRTNEGIYDDLFITNKNKDTLSKHSKILTDMFNYLIDHNNNVLLKEDPITQESFQIKDHIEGHTFPYPLFFEEEDTFRLMSDEFKRRFFIASEAAYVDAKIMLDYRSHINNKNNWFVSRFNILLARYLFFVYDSITKKFFSETLHTLFTEIEYIFGVNSYRNESYIVNAYVLATIMHIFTAQQKNGIYSHVVYTLSELPEYLIERYKNGLPFFKKNFSTLADSLKKMMTFYNIFKAQATTLNEQENKNLENNLHIMNRLYKICGFILVDIENTDNILAEKKVYMEYTGKDQKYLSKNYMLNIINQIEGPYEMNNEIQKFALFHNADYPFYLYGPILRNDEKSFSYYEKMLTMSMEKTEFIPFRDEKKFNKVFNNLYGFFSSFFFKASYDAYEGFNYDFMYNDLLHNIINVVKQRYGYLITDINEWSIDPKNVLRNLYKNDKKNITKYLEKTIKIANIQHADVLDYMMYLNIMEYNLLPVNVYNFMDDIAFNNLFNAGISFDYFIKANDKISYYGGKDYDAENILNLIINYGTSSVLTDDKSHDIFKAYVLKQTVKKRTAIDRIKDLSPLELEEFEQNGVIPQLLQVREEEVEDVYKSLFKIIEEKKLSQKKSYVINVPSIISSETGLPTTEEQIAIDLGMEDLPAYVDPAEYLYKVGQGEYTGSNGSSSRIKTIGNILNDDNIPTTKSIEEKGELVTKYKTIMNLLHNICQNLMNNYNDSLVNVLRDVINNYKRKNEGGIVDSSDCNKMTLYQLSNEDEIMGNEYILMESYKTNENYKNIISLIKKYTKENNLFEKIIKINKTLIQNLVKICKKLITYIDEKKRNVNSAFNEIFEVIKNINHKIIKEININLLYIYHELYETNINLENLLDIYNIIYIIALFITIFKNINNSLHKIIIYILKNVFDRPPSDRLKRKIKKSLISNKNHYFLLNTISTLVKNKVFNIVSFYNIPDSFKNSFISITLNYIINNMYNPEQFNINMNMKFLDINMNKIKEIINLSRYDNIIQNLQISNQVPRQKLIKYEKPIPLNVFTDSANSAKIANILLDIEKPIISHKIDNNDTKITLRNLTSKTLDILPLKTNIKLKEIFTIFSNKVIEQFGIFVDENDEVKNIEQVSIFYNNFIKNILINIYYFNDDYKKHLLFNLMDYYFYIEDERYKIISLILNKDNNKYSLNKNQHALFLVLQYISCNIIQCYVKDATDDIVIFINNKLLTLEVIKYIMDYLTKINIDPLIKTFLDDDKTKIIEQSKTSFSLLIKELRKKKLSNKRLNSFYDVSIIKEIVFSKELNIIVDKKIYHVVDYDDYTFKNTNDDYTPFLKILSKQLQNKRFNKDYYNIFDRLIRIINKSDNIVNYNMISSNDLHTKYIVQNKYIPVKNLNQFLELCALIHYKHILNIKRYCQLAYILYNYFIFLGETLNDIIDDFSLIGISAKFVYEICKLADNNKSATGFPDISELYEININEITNKLSLNANEYKNSAYMASLLIDPNIMFMYDFNEDHLFMNKFIEEFLYVSNPFYQNYTYLKGINMKGFAIDKNKYYNKKEINLYGKKKKVNLYFMKKEYGKFNLLNWGPYNNIIRINYNRFSQEKFNHNNKFIELNYHHKNYIGILNPDVYIGYLEDKNNFYDELNFINNTLINEAFEESNHNKKFQDYNIILNRIKNNYNEYQFLHKIFIINNLIKNYTFLYLFILILRILKQLNVDIFTKIIIADIIQIYINFLFFNNIVDDSYETFLSYLNLYFSTINPKAIYNIYKKKFIENDYVKINFKTIFDDYLKNLLIQHIDKFLQDRNDYIDNITDNEIKQYMEDYKIFQPIDSSIVDEIDNNIINCINIILYNYSIYIINILIIPEIKFDIVDSSRNLIFSSTNPRNVNISDKINLDIFLPFVTYKQKTNFDDHFYNKFINLGVTSGLLYSIFENHKLIEKKNFLQVLKYFIGIYNIYNLDFSNLYEYYDLKSLENEFKIVSHKTYELHIIHKVKYELINHIYYIYKEIWNEELDHKKMTSFKLNKQTLYYFSFKDVANILLLAEHSDIDIIKNYISLFLLNSNKPNIHDTIQLNSINTILLNINMKYISETMEKIKNNGVGVQTVYDTFIFELLNNDLTTKNKLNEYAKDKSKIFFKDPNYKVDLQKIFFNQNLISIQNLVLHLISENFTDLLEEINFDYDVNISILNNNIRYYPLFSVDIYTDYSNKNTYVSFITIMTIYNILYSNIYKKPHEIFYIFHLPRKLLCNSTRENYAYLLPLGIIDNYNAEKYFINKELVQKICKTTFDFIDFIDFIKIEYKNIYKNYLQCLLFNIEHYPLLIYDNIIKYILIYYDNLLTKGSLIADNNLLAILLNKNINYDGYYFKQFYSNKFKEVIPSIFAIRKDYNYINYYNNTEETTSHDEIYIISDNDIFISNSNNKFTIINNTISYAKSIFNRKITKYIYKKYNKHSIKIIDDNEVVSQESMDALNVFYNTFTDDNISDFNKIYSGIITNKSNFLNDIDNNSLIIGEKMYEYFNLIKLKNDKIKKIKDLDININRPKFLLTETNLLSNNLSNKVRDFIINNYDNYLHNSPVLSINNIDVIYNIGFMIRNKLYDDMKIKDIYEIFVEIINNKIDDIFKDIEEYKTNIGDTIKKLFEDVYNKYKGIYVIDIPINIWNDIVTTINNIMDWKSSSKKKFLNLHIIDYIILLYLIFCFYNIKYHFYNSYISIDINNVNFYYLYKLMLLYGITDKGKLIIPYYIYDYLVTMRRQLKVNEFVYGADYMNMMIQQKKIDSNILVDNTFIDLGLYDNFNKIFHEKNNDTINIFYTNNTLYNYIIYNFGQIKDNPANYNYITINDTYENDVNTFLNSVSYIIPIWYDDTFIYFTLISNYTKKDIFNIDNNNNIILEYTNVDNYIDPTSNEVIVYKISIKKYNKHFNNSFAIDNTYLLNHLTFDSFQTEAVDLIDPTKNIKVKENIILMGLRLIYYKQIKSPYLRNYTAGANEETEITAAYEPIEDFQTNDVNKNKLLSAAYMDSFVMRNKIFLEAIFKQTQNLYRKQLLKSREKYDCKKNKGLKAIE